MALNNFTSLKTAIANWLNRTDLTNEITDDFIKLTEADFNSKLRIRQMNRLILLLLILKLNQYHQDL